MAGTTTYYGISYPTNTDYVKDGAAAIQTVATGFDSAVAIPTYNAQTGTTYTFALTDVGKTVTASNASAQTYTIPPTASVAWATGTTLYVINLGAGVVTFAAGAGVTVTNTTQTLAQYQSARLVRTALNAWTVTPDSGQSGSGLTLISATTIGTTVSSVNVTGAFSAAYDAYKIIITGGVSSAAVNVGLKLGSTVTGYYLGVFGTVYSSAAFTGVSDNNAAAWTYAGFSTTTAITFNADLINPFLAKPTIISNHRASTGTTQSGAMGSGFLNDTTSYTDFTLTPASGTLTGGTIRVYGYNN
jgi:hypothetical protein